MNRHISDQQEELWTSQELLAPAVNTEPQESPDTSIEPASILISDRARGIGQLMSILNEENRAAGLRQAIESPHRRELERRYGSKTDSVVARAVEKARDREFKKKDLFAATTGMYAMLEAGIDVDEVKDMTALMYVTFNHKFGVGRVHAPERNKYARTVQKSANIITGQAPATRRKSA